MQQIDSSKVIDYFRSSILEARYAYTVWLALSFSRSEVEMGQENAERYVKIQSRYGGFFNTVERACLVNFVISILRCFESRTDDSYSLRLIDKQVVEDFIKANFQVLEKIKTARNKLFAHKDLKDPEVVIPSYVDLEIFFRNLTAFYNRFTREIDNSTTSFDNGFLPVIDDVESLMKNLYRGEKLRLSEIEMKWSWEESSNNLVNFFDNIRISKYFASG